MYIAGATYDTAGARSLLAQDAKNERVWTALIELSLRKGDDLDESKYFLEDIKHAV